MRNLAWVCVLLTWVGTALGADVKLSAEQQQAAEKLRAKGASVLQIASDTDSLAVNLALAGKEAGDAEVAMVKVLPKVIQLNLGGTAVTDAGLANVAGLTTLTHLHLDRTPVTDAGLEHLKGLSNLVYLNLYGTGVTDAGMEKLTGLKNLKRVYLWQTKVSDAGEKTLKAANAELSVNRGLELAAMAAKPAAEKKDEKPAADKKEEKKPEAKKDDKKEEKKDAKPAAVAADVKPGKPVNSVCPVSGKPVDAQFTLAFEGKTVGFCCENCPKAFAADPKKFAGKVKADAVPVAAVAAAKAEPAKPAKADEKKSEEKPKPAVAAAQPAKPAPAAEPAKPAVKKPEAAEKKVAADGNLLKPTADAKNWRFEQHESGKGNASAADGALVLAVTEAGGEPWHVQAFQTPLDLKDGKTYTLTFKAKADEPRDVAIQAGIDEEDWHFIGLDERASLGKEWKDYSYTFTAADVRPNKNRVGFVIGDAKGKVFIKDAVLKEGK